ncbi:hypothetical protein PCANC_15801 [Puccinia coronata f. sp. avenae]|uniref:Uncharacterized protein n=1 Tax=Puccinia coronata f. sp. avenae TaxID=200324 RepID=A0A2N5UE27_9BASI|nr:hypothetical protein PCANC_15801 [Puccinia coronata f. sp. avenae]
MSRNTDGVPPAHQTMCRDIPTEDLATGTKLEGIKNYVNIMGPPPRDQVYLLHNEGHYTKRPKSEIELKHYGRKTLVVDPDGKVLYTKSPTCPSCCVTDACAESTADTCNSCGHLLLLTTACV